MTPLQAMGAVQRHMVKIARAHLASHHNQVGGSLDLHGGVALANAARLDGHLRSALGGEDMRFLLGRAGKMRQYRVFGREQLRWRAFDVGIAHGTC